MCCTWALPNLPYSRLWQFYSPGNWILFAWMKRFQCKKLSCIQINWFKSVLGLLQDTCFMMVNILSLDYLMCFLWHQANWILKHTSSKTVKLLYLFHFILLHSVCFFYADTMKVVEIKINNYQSSCLHCALFTCIFKDLIYIHNSLTQCVCNNMVNNCYKVANFTNPVALQKFH